MVTSLYPDFLEDAEQYERSERFWASLFSAVAAELGQDGEWAPWRPRAFLNGTPFEKDGNPIFDARSERLRKAVQIIQSPAASAELEITGWVSERLLLDEGEGVRLYELTINCSLSEESAQVAEELLRRWLDPDVSAEEMERVIELIAPSIDGS